MAAMIAVWCMMYFGCNACWVEWLSQISTDTNTFIISHCLMFARAICVDCGLPNEWGRRAHTHTRDPTECNERSIFYIIFFLFFSTCSTIESMRTNWWELWLANISEILHLHEAFCSWFFFAGELCNALLKLHQTAENPRKAPNVYNI